MNNDMISRAALLSVIEGLWNVLNDPEARYALSHVNRFIEVAPAVDAEPVRHSSMTKPTMRGVKPMCKECHIAYVKQDEWQYCPFCGAKMGGGAVDE